MAGAPGVHEEALAKGLSGVRGTLLLHFRKEEEGLFPEVQQMVSEGAPAVDIIAGFFREQSDEDLKAHTLLRGRMLEMSELLARLAASGGGSGKVLERLGLAAEATYGLLQRHARKEETVVFPIIERLLDEAQMAVVAGRMGSIERSAQGLLPGEQARP